MKVYCIEEVCSFNEKTNMLTSILSIKRSDVFISDMVNKIKIMMMLISLLEIISKKCLPNKLWEQLY